MFHVWHNYRRTGIAKMRPYINGEDIAHVSVSLPDKEAGSPKEGDMIAMNPQNPEDQWLVAKRYFEDNFEIIELEPESGVMTFVSPF